MEMSRSSGGGGWGDDNGHDHEKKGGGKEKVCLIISLLLGLVGVLWIEYVLIISVWQDEEEDEEEEEFTIGMMLKTMGIDFKVIGFDGEGQRWV